MRHTLTIQTLRNFCCKSKAGLWIAVIVGIMTAISVSNQSHADTVEGITVKIKGTGLVRMPLLTEWNRVSDRAMASQVMRGTLCKI